MPKTTQPDGLRYSTTNPGRCLHRSSAATGRSPLHLRIKQSISHALIHVRNSVEEKQSLRGRRSRLGRCRFCRNFLLRENAPQNRVAIQKRRRELSSSEKPEEPLTHVHVSRFKSMYRRRRLGNLTDSFRFHVWQKRRSRDRKYGD